MPIHTQAIDLPGKSAYTKEFSVSLRAITPVEVKYIISLANKQQKDNKDYINFLKRLVIFSNPEMTFEELYWFDVQYILYRIRFLTYTRYPLKLNFDCSECGEKIKVELDMSSLNILEPTDIEGRTDTITLDNLGEVHIRNKIMRDDLEIDEIIRKLHLDDDPYTRLLLLDLCLISDGKYLMDLWKLAEDGTITPQDIMTIEEWFVKNVWGVKEEILVRCPKCGKEETREFTLPLEAFFSVF